MLAIRMQRTGRKGQAMFRVVVQDSRQAPTSGRVVAQLGSYDPHTKTANLDKEKVSFYMEHGAQPSDRAAHLFEKEGITLPKWVSVSSTGQRATRNPEKLRKNRPAEERAEEPKAETPAEEPATDTADASTTSTETTTDTAEVEEVSTSEPEAQSSDATETEEKTA